jgi:hypothetical protein
MNYARYSDQPEQPHGFFLLLQKYLELIPTVTKCPMQLDYLETRILSQRDLNARNIFIVPETGRITGITGWQGASTARILHRNIPSMFSRGKPASLPSELLSDSADVDPKRGRLRASFEDRVLPRDVQLYSAIHHNERRQLPIIDPFDWYSNDGRTGIATNCTSH